MRVLPLYKELPIQDGTRIIFGQCLLRAHWRIKGAGALAVRCSHQEHAVLVQRALVKRACWDRVSVRASGKMAGTLTTPQHGGHGAEELGAVYFSLKLGPRASKSLSSSKTYH